MKKYANSPNLAAIGVLSLAVLLTAFTLVAAKTPTVISYGSRQVLGDSDTNEAAKKAAEQASEQQKQAQEQQQHQQEQQTQGGGSVNIQQDGQKKEMEIQQGGQKLKIKVEDNGSTKIEGEKSNAKFKLQVENGDVVIKTEDKSGDLVNASKKEHKEIDDFLKENEIEIASEDGKVKIERHGIEAHTEFPLSVDPTTRQLVVTTPAGQKSVTVLPDQAVQNMLSGGVLSTVASGSATPGVAPTTGVQLEMRNGNLVYRIDGQKDLRFLGFIPVTTSTTAFVSPDSGQIVAQEQSLLTSILRFLSR